MSLAQERAALAPMDVAGRLGRLRERMAAAEAVPGGAPVGEAILVTKQENVRYLTGFTGSSGMLLVTPRAALLLTDGRYREQAGAELAQNGVEADLAVDRLGGQLHYLQRATTMVRTLALEEHAVSWALHARLAESLNARLVPSGGVIEQLRLVKDAGELARVEAACEIADVALAQVKERLAERPSEAEMAAELEHEMRRRGASGPAFETIVAAGPNAARPHARPSDRQIGEGEPVVIDFGAVVDGYRSDMTRTLCVGTPPQDLGELIDAVFAAQRAGVRAVSAGVPGGEVDRACRESLESAGLGQFFVHGTGHGVGLEIHEAPALGPEAADILLVGSVVTVEPGAYLPQRGGARIEDTLVVTESGARALTKSTKDYTL